MEVEVNETNLNSFINVSNSKEGCHKLYKIIQMVDLII